MSRKLPEEYVSSRERRSVGRLAVVLWAGLLLVLLAFVGVTLEGVAADANEPVVKATGESKNVVRDASNAREQRSVESSPEVRAEQTGAVQTERAEGIVERYFPEVDFSFDFGRGSGLDFHLSTGTIDVRFAGLGGGDGRHVGTIRHGAIDEGVAQSSRTGLCVVGLDGADAPLSLDVDPQNSSVVAELSSEVDSSANESGSDGSVAAFEACSTGSG